MTRDFACFLVLPHLPTPCSHDFDFTPLVPLNWAGLDRSYCLLAVDDDVGTDCVPKKTQFFSLLCFPGCVTTDSLMVIDDAPREEFSPRQRHTLKEFAVRSHFYRFLYYPLSLSSCFGYYWGYRLSQCAKWSFGGTRYGRNSILSSRYVPFLQPRLTLSATRRFKYAYGIKYRLR